MPGKVPRLQITAVEALAALPNDQVAKMRKQIGFPEPPDPPRPDRSWIRLAILGAFLGPIIALLIQFRTNLHVVIPGQIYRSGQLDPVTLDNHIDWLHLKTIVNLRGAGPQSDWYLEERAVARRRRLRFIDFPIDSALPLEPKELRRLITILQQDTAPILIHCQSGIDRSGIMAVTCTLLLDDVHGLQKAQDQLQWSNGNLPWFKSTKNIRAYLARYQQWLSENGMEHSRQHFCQWALNRKPATF